MQLIGTYQSGCGIELSGTDVVSMERCEQAVAPVGTRGPRLNRNVSRDKRRSDDHWPPL
jgi:hypothetical protein